MPYFINPFKKHDVSEFSGVLVPLEQAPPRKRSLTTRAESDTEKIENYDESKEHEQSSAPFTLEILKREIEEDLSAGGLDSAYDRM